MLLFVALGVGIGFVPEADRSRESEAPRAAPADSAESLSATPASALADSVPPPETDAVARDLYPIDVNRAEAELLCELPGIGPSKARAILEARAQNGPFRSAEDLTRVRGIGPGTVRRFHDLVTFGETRDGSRAEDSTLGQPPARSAPPGA